MKLTDWHAKIKSLVPGRCVWQAHVQLLSDIQANVVRFLADDALHGGRCERVWTGLLHLAFDEFRDLDLCAMILQLCGRCFFNRENAAERPALLDFIEYCSGLGNLTKALLRKQMHGACFDYLYSPNHNMLTKEGLRLFIEALAAARTNCLCWFGTACSSFVRLCSSQSCRRPENGYYGDESRPWVFSGNCMSDISSLLFFLALCTGCIPVLEQPMTSCMVLTDCWARLIHFGQLCRTLTYMGAYGGPSVKPITLFHQAQTFEALKRPKPDWCIESLTTRNGEQWTGKKDALVESGWYTKEFGESVASIFAGSV